MNIGEATKNYEGWMRAYGPIVRSELQDKHAQMKKDPFQFLRGTYYRWAQVWPEVCSEVRRAPSVVSVGDLHIDSFGTWRDSEGRLCWGVDDFDEAWPLPYTNDLIRLAASVKIARRVGILKIGTRYACEVLLGAYRRTLERGGCPFVLAEEETHLEKLGIEALKPPRSFWKTLNERPTIRGKLPREAKHALEKNLPDPNLGYRVVHREAGLGSLGQLRFVAIAERDGGCVAREVKKLVPSASAWLGQHEGIAPNYYKVALTSAVRSPDPYQSVASTWLIRRLSPDANPIEVEDLSKRRDEEILLEAMGSEAANIHLGEPRRTRAIVKDLKKRKSNWLHTNAKRMARLWVQEWKEFKK